MSLTSSTSYKSCDITITILDGGSNATFKLIDLGEIKFDFDLQSLSDAVNRVVVLYSSVSLSLYAFDNTGINIYDRLQANLSNTCNVTMDIRFRDTYNVFKSVFSLNKSRIKYDEITRIIDFDLSSPTLPSNPISNVFNLTPISERVSYQLNSNTGNVFYNAVSPGRFVNSAFSLFGNDLNLIMRSGLTTPSVNSIFTERLFDDFTADNIICASPQTAYVIADVSTFPTINASGFDLIRYMSAIEGAFFGIGLDKNFYINRLDTTSNVTLSNSELKSLKFITSEQAYSVFSFGINAVTVNVANNFPKITSATNTTIIDFLGRKSLTFRTDFAGAMTKGRFSETVNGRVNGDYAGNVLADIENETVNVGVSAYSTAFNREGALTIDGEIIGCEKVKPYNVILFDNTLSERFQNKHFRISYVYYNFKTDIVKFKAYQI
jgi:hypothetical protein